MALVAEVLPDTGETAKDLGVFNTAGALPQSVAPAMAPALIALGTLTPLGGYTLYFLVGALLAIAAVVMIYRIQGVK